PDVFQKKFLNGEYIGTPLSIEEISNQFDLIMTKKPYKLTEKLIYLGEIPRLTSFEAQNPIGKQEIQGLLEDDYIVDDSALVYHAKNGLFIITGCSHSGICNIIEYAKKVCHEDRIVGIIGGFHLLKDDEQLNQTIEYFKQCHIKTLYPCHCVSLQAKAQMMQQLHIEEVGVGLQIDVE
ncbi:MAG: MBL fold metallo-hydrolase, partial [Traorella sp.]